MDRDDEYRRERSAEDDYRRRQHAEDDRSWQNFQDDREWREERAREQARKVREALERGDHDTAQRLVGMEPEDAYPGTSDTPAPTLPPTAGELYVEHTQALLAYLRAAEGLLPPECLGRWATFVEQLDRDQPELGLATMGLLLSEHRQAAQLSAPPDSEYVTRIGQEMEYVASLFRFVLGLQRHVGP